MQQFAKIERHESHYHCNDSSDYEMCIMGEFLASDVSDSAKGFIESILDKSLKGIEGNLTRLEKQNEIIIMSDIYSEQDDGGPYFEVRKLDLIQMLEEWDKIFQLKPEEIMITKENGKVTMTFKN